MKNKKDSTKQLKFIKKLKSKPWIANGLSCLGAILYLVQSIYSAHHLDVTMDEGTYLVKGFLYVTGVYRPFQPYGPWTNKMPLAFTIPGLAQSVFEPGLRTGRYFAVFLSMLMLLGMWLVTRRLRGNWWAALIVWALALNAGNITYYSRAISQGLVACMLVWMLVLVLGKERKLWQIILAAILASMMVMTRQNMLPVPFLLILYIFWERGWRSAVVSAVAVLLVLGIYHVVYWPDIMRIWLPYLPKFIKPLFSAAVIKTGGATSTSIQTYDFLSKLYVFWEAFRLNFFALVGSIACWIFWPRRKDWSKDAEFRAAVFLSILIIVLFAAHFWASFFKNYCLYCFPGYLAFFIPAAFLLIAISFPSWDKDVNLFRQLIAAVFIILSGIGIGFGAYQVLEQLILDLQVPRMQNMRILPGTIELWRFLSNKFGWSYEALQKSLPTLAGFLFASALLTIVLVILRLNKKGKFVQFGYYFLVSFWIIGAIFTPTKVLGGGKYADYCNGDVITSHEKVGTHLAELIPPDALVYWKNDVSPLPLLYLPGRRIFPPQLNHWFNYVKGGEADSVYRKSLWNEELSQQWMVEADFLLIADAYVNGFNNDQQFKGEVDELTPTPITVPCRDKSIIHVFRRIK